MIGIHIDSTPEYIIKTVKEVINKNANLVQFFVIDSIKNKEIYDELKKYLIKNKMHCVIHASYTINLAQNWDDYSWWIHQFIREIEIAENIGAKYITVHLGKKLNLSLEESINNMYTSLLHIYQKIKDFKIEILLETSTGQGSEIGYKLDELAIIYRKFSKHKNKNISEKFGICLDTCHIFSAGYDIKSQNSREVFFDNFNELIGLDQIKLVHLNDSKVPINSNVDRHENYGFGYIGEEAIISIANFFKKRKTAIIIESPYPKIYNDLKLIQ